MHIDARRLGQAQHPITVEVALLHLAANERDVAPERRRQSEENAALDLLIDDVRVHHLSAVDDAGDAVNGELAVCHGDFGDLRHVGAVAFHQRDALMVSGGRLTPAGAACRLIKHPLEARLLVEQGGTKRVRVFPRCARQFVHEALRDEAVECMAHRAPVADVDADFLAVVVHRDVGHVIGIVGGSLDGERVNRSLDDGREHARRDRGPRQIKLPGDELARRIESSRDRIEGGRAVGVVGHVLFATPDHLHRLADRFGGDDRCGNEIDFESSTEAAAEQRGVDLDLFGFEPGSGCSRGLGNGLRLGRRVEVDGIGTDVCGAALRLEGRMGQHRQLIGRANDFGRALQCIGGVAVIAYRTSGSGGGLAQPRANGLVVE